MLALVFCFDKKESVFTIELSVQKKLEWFVFKCQKQACNAETAIGMDRQTNLA